MTGTLKKLTTLVALALITALGATAVLAQNPKRPAPKQTTQKKDTVQKQDQDRDRDFDRDRDQDMDRDRDRDQDRDRLSRPMTAQEKQAMERQMTQSRDHILAAGYRQNMLNFALNLRLRLEQGDNIDRDLARRSVKEIKRNFQEMEKRHNAHKKEMGAETRKRMAYMIQEMEEHQARIRNTIRTLENDAAADSPNSRQMLMHVRELEEQIRLMEQARQQKNVGASMSMNTRDAYLDLAIL
jgi:hypothetical protein